VAESGKILYSHRRTSRYPPWYRYGLKSGTIRFSDYTQQSRGGRLLTRRDGVDANVLLAQLTSHTSCHLQHARLGRIIRDPRLILHARRAVSAYTLTTLRRAHAYLVGNASAHTGNHDDTPRLATGLDHPPGRSLTGVEHTVQVDLHDSLPILLAVRQTALSLCRSEDPGCGHAEVESPLFSGDLINNEGRDPGLIGHIGRMVSERGAVLELVDVGYAGMEIRGRLGGEVERVNLGASFTQRDGHFETQPAVPSRDLRSTRSARSG
jgi:hypothetical protein